jgi:hypothetical protein
LQFDTESAIIKILKEGKTSKPKKLFQKVLKNLLTSVPLCGIIKIPTEGERKKTSKKSFEKVLTNSLEYGIIKTQTKGCDLPQERN